jgi:UDP:flavonoid glycosyltransferase YjiC (YdhE family)
MRILFTFIGGSGHFEPLVPVARATAQAGHTIAVAARASMLPTIEAAELTGIATRPDVGNPPERLPLLELSAEREERDLRERFARRGAREQANDILTLCAGWQPDLIVCDEVDFGSMIAAECLGLPYASVLVLATGSLARHEVVAEPLHELRAAHGLPPDLELAMLSRYLVLSPFPPSLRDPRFPLPATAHSYRSAMPTTVSDDFTRPWLWLERRRDVPLVYFTLGTVFNLESGDLFARVLAGLRDLPMEFVVTVGPHIDPAEFDPQPPNIHLEQYIPQSLLLPHCSAVISHGGSGSVLGALAHGLPMVLIPMGADQPLNAARCEELGVARVLDAVRATPGDVRSAVLEVLEDATYRINLERIKAEIDALPGPESTVPLLERLVAK